MAPVKNPESDPTDMVKEISSIYSRWREGGLSQEDALFEIGDCLAKWVPDEVDTTDPVEGD
jgi:hypothetical protein